MSSNDNEPIFSAGNPTGRRDPGYSINSNAGAVTAQDQLLLEALQQFIVPHVGTAADQTGSNQNFRGPEAMKLVTALKEFISSVVRGSELKAKTTIEVNLDEDVHESETAQDVDNADKRQEIQASTLPDIFSISRNVLHANAFHDNVLRRLREHVFNSMPIRLLHFVPQGSCLRISLANKEDIYTHLVSVIEEHRSDPDYRPKQLRRRGETETDDEAATRLIRKHTGYAILSHTWLHTSLGEVTYANWINGIFDRHSAGYQKLVNFCKATWKNHGLTLGWMDTVCINKDSSSELDESIRSMYNWYKGAKVCIVYLGDTQTILDIHLDTWFTRGWTLQELLAPDHIKFYNQDWDCFVKDASSNDKWDSGSGEIRAQILKATTINRAELRHIFSAPLSRRMQLAASRKVTRKEDMAYSLMGIFNVSISTAYGEGAERAFRRLLYEILTSKSQGVLDLFNWAGEHFRWTDAQSQLLPLSPANYTYRSSNDLLPYIYTLAPLTITHMGIYISVLLMPIALSGGQEVQHNPIGDYSAQLTVSMKDDQYYPFTTATLLFLDTKALDAVKYKNGNNIWYQAAVFNIRQGSRGIYVPQACFAKLLCCYEHPGQVTSLGPRYVCDTEEPLVFDIKYTGLNNPDVDNSGCWIPENELAAHGMQFISLYL